MSIQKIPLNPPLKKGDFKTTLPPFPKGGSGGILAMTGSVNILIGAAKFPYGILVFKFTGLASLIWVPLSPSTVMPA